MKQSNPNLSYSEEFKRKVVEEIETGTLTVSEAARYYGIHGATTIYRWMSIYGMNATKGRKVIIMSNKEETELITLRRELALLKKQLEEAELRAIAWESMVDAIEQDLGMKVKKKPWSQALEEAKARLYPGEYEPVSKDSAGSTESASKPDTSGKRLKRRK